jgi:hypothetical protein
MDIIFMVLLIQLDITVHEYGSFIQVLYQQYHKYNIHTIFSPKIVMDLLMSSL